MQKKLKQQQKQQQQRRTQWHERTEAIKNKIQNKSSPHIDTHTDGKKEKSSIL